MPSLGVGQSLANKPPATPSIQHDAGQLFGHALNALPGYSTFGSNITNPTVNYMGVTNPAYGGPPAPAAPAPTFQGQTAPNPTPLGGGAQLSGGAAPAPAVNPNQFKIDQINASLGRLPTQLGIAQGNIQGEYNTNLNELNSGQQQAQGQYDQGKNQNTQNFVQNKNQITNQASGSLHSLLRLLGMHGAGGSSDALYSAPQTVATQAAQQRSGASQTFGQNAQGLDTNWNNYQTGFNQSKQKLSDWLSQNLDHAQSQSDSTHSGLLQSLAGLQPSVAAAQPMIDESNALLAQVDQLGALHPTYTGTAPTYTAPSVASYTVNPAAPIQQANSALDSTTSPFMSLLLGNQKDKKQLAPAFSY